MVGRKKERGVPLRFTAFIDPTSVPSVVQPRIGSWLCGDFLPWVSPRPLPINQPHFIATTTMKLLASISALLPQLHAFLDEDSFYQLGATWTAADGLREQHNLELRYTHNSERLALQGQPMPNGSWRYVAPNGRVHTISADRARDFMETTHRHATVMVGMLDRLREAGVAAPTFDTQQAT